MRSLLETEIEGESGEEHEVQNGLRPLKWPRVLTRPLSSVGAESGEKERQIRRAFHSDYYVLRSPLICMLSRTLSI
jgi:hypothetical protein